jgi:hypothetical protein
MPSSSSVTRAAPSALLLLPPPTAGAASRVPHPATFPSHASPSTSPTSAPLFPWPLPRWTRPRRRRAVATELLPWPAPHRAPNSYVARASAPLGAPRPILALHSPAPRPYTPERRRPSSVTPASSVSPWTRCCRPPPPEPAPPKVVPRSPEAVGSGQRRPTCRDTAVQDLPAASHLLSAGRPVHGPRSPTEPLPR